MHVLYGDLVEILVVISSHAFVFICYNATQFLCRMGFSAEQLARWVAERTDVNVCGLLFVFTLEEICYRCSFI